MSDADAREEKIELGNDAVDSLVNDSQEVSDEGIDRTGMIVVSGKSHVNDRLGRNLCFRRFDFRDNRVGPDSYFDEADL